MSAFNNFAGSVTENISGKFGVASLDAASFKPEVVAGIKQSLNQSFGHDNVPKMTFAL